MCALNESRKTIKWKKEIVQDEEKDEKTRVMETMA